MRLRRPRLAVGRARRRALLVLLLLPLAALSPSACAGDDAPRRTRPGEESFAGVELSAVQRTRIRLMQERYVNRIRALQRRVMPVLYESRRAWLRGDSAAGAAAWARSAADRAALRAIGDSMRAEIRAILTAEQRPRFDRNVAAILARSDDLDRRQGRPKSPDVGVAADSLGATQR